MLKSSFDSLDFDADVSPLPASSFSFVGKQGKAEDCLSNRLFLPLSRAPCYCGGYFLYIFSGFAIDRSKMYIKTIEIYIKIDAVDP